jgi:ribonuclease D
LSAAAELYATNDVAHLFDIADELFNDLASLGRVAAFEEECEATLSATSRELQLSRCWWNVSNRETVAPQDELTLQHLAAAREELAEQLNLTRRYLIPDDVLLAMAKAHPRHPDAVRSFVGRRIDDHYLPRFVQAVRDAEASDGTDLDRPIDDRGGDTRALISVLQALVTQRALAQGIEPSFLASKNDLVARIEGRASKLDRGWREEHVTAAIDAIIAGNAGLVWRAGELQLVDLSE